MSRQKSLPSIGACRTRKPIQIQTSEFAVTIEKQRYYGRSRYYWTISSLCKPDELIVWGHADTPLLAEMAAETALRRLE